jgi:chromate transporter
MNLFVLYLILLKATATSFGGLASLPLIRNDLVVKRAVLTDRQLNAAVAVGRATPGPAGLYIVSIGYFAAGVPGAFVGWLAQITPALLVIPTLSYLGRRAAHPRVKGALEAVVVTSGGLLLAASIPLATETLSNLPLIIIAALSCLVLVTTRINSIWVIVAAAVVSLGAEAITSVMRL